MGNAIVGTIILTISIHIAEGVSIELLLIIVVAISIGVYAMKK